MPSEYILKRSVIDGNRIQKISKKVIDECKEDRTLALEGYRYFKLMVDENPNDSSAKSQMVDCLKLAQNSKGATIKILEMLVKIEATERSQKSDTTKNYSVFHELEGLDD
tara:strand:- start:749 stop:1078 length:330 start_codon:yes stop_codon:yes gene_type:complete